MREMSARKPLPHLPASVIRTGTGRAIPHHTWIGRTSPRRPTAAESGPTYRTAAVDIAVRKRAALTQWSARSATSKRTSRSRSARGAVVATIRLPDPTVDVVAPDLPVAGLGLAGNDVDAVE